MAPPLAEAPIADRIRAVVGQITPAEQKVARALTASAMLAGFETVAALAERAGVSGPTVIRLTAKLGFESYASFQRALLQELEARGTSPLSLYHRADKRPGDLLRQSAEAFASGIDETLRCLSPSDFETAVSLLAESRNRIFITGGRFTQLLAQMLYLHLFQLRPNLHMLNAGLQTRADQVLDIGPRSVLVAFDLRRYEAETVAVARAAKQRGAKLIVVTDPWLSPAAEAADAVLTVQVGSPSPFDSMVPACALTEALIGEIVVRLGARGLRRVEDLEALRTGAAEPAQLKGKAA